MSTSLLDIVAQLDNFPYYEKEPIRSNALLKEYRALKIQGINEILGYISNTIVEGTPWPEEHWDTGSPDAVVLKTPPRTPISARTKIIENAIHRIAQAGNDGILKNWRNERFPVYGPDAEVVMEIERSASAHFGIVTSGVQMLCYVEDANGLIRLWIAKRSEKKQTYPGMLDCTAAGALTVGDSPRSAVVREATEEASLDKTIIKRDIRSAGCISYFHMKGSSSVVGQENPTSLLLPEVEYLYELKLDEGVVPQPNDSEVEDFRLWTVDEVLEALRNCRFKLNSAVVIIDFFIRHGIVTPQTEPNYIEIIARLHRRLPFPTAQHCSSL
ncbi:putative NUDIX family hydrolase [Aspergillus avenaceus]|uniref:Putative NUDIX family hydrolase n=1 Tax=Aspergillus avenaceus TaxID=36643 RepID=A0A5N6U3A3_ASPAV|nr:putative NUDIX family hydrolase [Aspergillus avenaceus]